MCFINDKLGLKKKGLIGVTRPTLVTLPTLDIFINFSNKNKQTKRLKKEEVFLHFLSLFTSKTSDYGAFKKKLKN